MNCIKSILSLVSLAFIIPLFPGCEDKPQAPAAGTYNHDMSAYKKLAQEAIALAKEDKLPDAFSQTKKLEKAWDDGTDDMMKADTKLHTEIDDQMDAAIDATNPAKGGTKDKSVAELQKFIDMLDKVPAK